ncbi:MAG: hypothetical protein IPN94_20700 [Sphingobacteriales bacterium]|nr:hypothetical protein [Sphingobacteriales bacterium]
MFYYCYFTIVNANPTVTVNSPTVCVGSLITLTAVPVGGTSPALYAWTEPWNRWYINNHR